MAGETPGNGQEQLGGLGNTENSMASLYLIPEFRGILGATSERAAMAAVDHWLDRRIAPNSLRGTMDPIQADRTASAIDLAIGAREKFVETAKHWRTMQVLTNVFYPLENPGIWHDGGKMVEILAQTAQPLGPEFFRDFMNTDLGKRVDGTMQLLDDIGGGRLKIDGVGHREEWDEGNIFRVKPWTEQDILKTQKFLMEQELPVEGGGKADNLAVQVAWRMMRLWFHGEQYAVDKKLEPQAWPANLFTDVGKQMASRFFREGKFSSPENRDRHPGLGGTFQGFVPPELSPTALFLPFLNSEYVNYEDRPYSLYELWRVKKLPLAKVMDLVAQQDAGSYSLWIRGMNICLNVPPLSLVEFQNKPLSATDCLDNHKAIQLVRLGLILTLRPGAVIDNMVDAGLLDEPANVHDLDWETFAVLVKNYKSILISSTIGALEEYWARLAHKRAYENQQANADNNNKIPEHFEQWTLGKKNIQYAEQTAARSMVDSVKPVMDRIQRSMVAIEVKKKTGKFIGGVMQGTQSVGRRLTEQGERLKQRFASQGILETNEEVEKTLAEQTKEE